MMGSNKKALKLKDLKTFSYSVGLRTTKPTKKKNPPSPEAKVGEVGRTGFEPATPWSQTRYSTGLNYLPNMFP
jgi:hypothetical protein